MEADYPEIWLCGWKSTVLYAVSGALSTILEKVEEWIIFSFGRTHNRIRSPRLKASSR
jgi:hypothetical protein